MTFLDRETGFEYSSICDCKECVVFFRNNIVITSAFGSPKAITKKEFERKRKEADLCDIFCDL